MKPVPIDYQDVNDDKIKFEGKTPANIERDGTKRQLELLITTKQTNKPITRIGLVGKTRDHTNTDKNSQTVKHIISKPGHTNCGSDREIATLKSKFHKFFPTNHTVKSVEVDIQLKDDAKLSQ